MAPSNRFTLRLLPVVLAAAASVACSDTSRSASFSGDSDNGGAAPAPSSPVAPGPDSNGSAERAVAEADIVQLHDGRLYAMSRSGSLSIIDVSRPGRLTMLGQAYLPGEPFEMYLRGDMLVVMTNGAYAVSGQPNQASGQSSRGDAPSAIPTRDPNSGAGVLVLNVKDPGLMQRVATFPVPGEIADSRIVGDILYLVTYENAECYGCSTSARTMVTTFDIASPTTMDQIDHAAFESSANWMSWGAVGFKRSVLATSERLYVGGTGDVMPSSGATTEGVIDVLDITDPRGKLVRGAHIETVGAITSRWQMDEKDGVLRVVSQKGAGYMTNGVGSPEVQTFHIWNTGSMQAMGRTSIKLPRQEALKAVRFDGERAYAITFFQGDPLFVIDLSDEAAPKQRGELHMPGWVFHLEPRGNRVIGLGLDRNAAGGNLNVSLFDVADMDNPTMLQRVAFGSVNYGTDQSIVDYELPEDQDRIQKAFRILEDGLIVAPFSGGDGSPVTSCASLAGGVQLIEWSQYTLTKRATLPVAGNPRRALVNNQTELLAVSDSNVTSFDIGRRDVALKTADLVIGSCESRPTSTGTPVTMPTGQRGAEGAWADDSYDNDGYLCSMSAAGHPTRGPVWAGLAFGIVALGGALRRRRAHG
jgi:hypothetical protein